MDACILCGTYTPQGADLCPECLRKYGEDSFYNSLIEAYSNYDDSTIELAEQLSDVSYEADKIIEKYKGFDKKE